MIIKISNSRINNSNPNNQSGFTLVELLVTVGIIGILASIAIPQFVQYKIKAFNARSKSDNHNVITAQEAYYIDFESYSDSETNLPGFTKMSPGVTLTLTTSNSGQNFESSTYHGSGDETHCYDNETTSKGIIVVSGTSTACP